jgi:hypothetical protein
MPYRCAEPERARKTEKGRAPGRPVRVPAIPAANPYGREHKFDASAGEGLGDRRIWAIFTTHAYCNIPA